MPASQGPVQLSPAGASSVPPRGQRHLPCARLQEHFPKEKVLLRLVEITKYWLVTPLALLQKEAYCFV